MRSITLDGVTFRWDGQELLVTTANSQKRLTGSSAATLLDFLLVIQQDLYTAEQGARVANVGVATTDICEWKGERGATAPTH